MATPAPVVQKGWAWDLVDERERRPWEEPDDGVLGMLRVLPKGTDLHHLRVYDMGCGLGRHAVYFARLGCHVHASDITAEAVNSTRAWLVRDGLCSAAQAERRVVQGRMTQLQQTDAWADIVVCFNVVYHALRADVDKGVQELVRVMKPGGLLFITFISRDWHKPFTEELVAENTTVKRGGAEDGVPHFYAHHDDVLHFLRNLKVIYTDLREEFGDAYRTYTYPSFHYRVLARKG
eukprot:TRINITY_DN2263_c0_g1_i3.p1 TRINITY_DN2263_c0_g1~~TRINITY_DN2263_c0_g1_i3.p1  ORF type:complete len:246 (-),score=61.18 TRINITY_DN2263_c0_g1_i3:473-1177(-)